MSVTFGSFGEVPEDMERTEFWAWFHLQVTGTDERPDGSKVVRVGTSGVDFRDYVRLFIATDPDGHTTRLALELDEHFIDTPQLAPFAADIARSFIGGAVASDEDVALVRPIADDLSWRPATEANRALSGAQSVDEVRNALQVALDKGETVTVRMGGLPVNSDPGAVESRGYAVYAGNRDSFERALSETDFAMRNDASGGTRVLTISFARRD